MPIDVYLESGAKRVFACVLAWPGWCRSGRDESGALEALADYAPRYRVVAEQAGLRLPSRLGFEVTQRLEGTGATDFGVPHAVPPTDSEPVSAAEAKRAASLVRASWAVFDQVVTRAPTSLRKGPRGGGRDRGAIVEHVLAAETAYASKLGIKQPEPAARRSAIIEVLGARSPAWTPAEKGAKGWPPRYAARRIAWHVLDHAWEIEDRAE